MFKERGKQQSDEDAQTRLGQIHRRCCSPLTSGLDGDEVWIVQVLLGDAPHHQTSGDVVAAIALWSLRHQAGGDAVVDAVLQRHVAGLAGSGDHDLAAAGVGRPLPASPGHAEVGGDEEKDQSEGGGHGDQGRQDGCDHDLLATLAQAAGQRALAGLGHALVDAGRGHFGVGVHADGRALTLGIVRVHCYNVAVARVETGDRECRRPGVGGVGHLEVGLGVQHLEHESLGQAPVEALLAADEQGRIGLVPDGAVGHRVGFAGRD